MESLFVSEAMPRRKYITPKSEDIMQLSVIKMSRTERERVLGKLTKVSPGLSGQCCNIILLCSQI